MIWLVVIFGIVLTMFGLTVLRGAPYVPSRRQDIDKAFDELYVLNKKDVLVDIGSGDGVVLRAAARRGATAVGLEINPLLVGVSNWLSRHEERVTVRLTDFWVTTFPDSTTVVYTFGESRDIAKMYRKVQSEATRLARPLWFISYGFAVPGVSIYKQTSSHHLYEIIPLQKMKA